MIKGMIIGGQLNNILMRQKSNAGLEIGELLVSEDEESSKILQVVDLLYGSQMNQQNLELLSGLCLEDGNKEGFMDENIRNYNLALLKNLISIKGKDSKLTKSLPRFFSEIREIKKEDLSFLTKPENSIFVGKLRSGSKVLDVDLFLPGEKVFRHHILVAATTGRGKSNLTANILWDSLEKGYCGVLVLDPHDEYYGRNGLGMKDCKIKEMVEYYTINNPPVGAKTLKINLKKLKPEHFRGIVNFSDPQRQMLYLYHRKYGEDWVDAILFEKKIEAKFMEDTVNVVKRKLMKSLGLEMTGTEIQCKGIFDKIAGVSTINDIIRSLEESKTVIIDTSSLGGEVELLIGSIITGEVFNQYKYYKMIGTLDEKPVVSVVLEEAPRVLGKDVLEKGSNIFETIAREGRKFKVGLFAITQLPSLIPRQILANMNTKIILGIEMAPERQAIIESSSQDLSADNRNIASLDIGEAIISSTFARFAMPIRIPLFKDVVDSSRSREKMNFSGISEE